MAHPPFNPLDKRALGESVADALLERRVGPLPPEQSFPGAGIYAIYYTGSFDLYAPIAERNRNDTHEQPIYVGKAVPEGSRKGGFGLGTAPGNVLYKRLREHATSIKVTRDLQLQDFACRYLIADDIWIPLGESLLIERFRPVWNVLVDGFGNHPTGKPRSKQKRSLWDTLHRGRGWAQRLPPNAVSIEQLRGMVAAFLAGQPVKTISIQDAVAREED